MMNYPVIIVIFVMLRILYFLKQRERKVSNQYVIVDACEAKEFLKKSDLISRARSNQNLYSTFGISNPFTNPSSTYHNEFRKVVSETITNVNWNNIKDVAFKSVNDYTKSGLVEIVPWIQKITLNVVLRGYLNINVNVDEIVDVAPSIINDLWLKSKELNGVAEKDEKLTSMKRILNNLFCKETFKDSETMQKISKISQKHFPNAFGLSSNVADMPKLNHNPSSDELESPLNILIPAYETMWRVVLYTILEIKVRPSLRNEGVDEEIDSGKLDDAVKLFLKNPDHSTLKNSLLSSIVSETLRLYPPTRHIHRINENFSKVTIDAEKIHFNTNIWGEDALSFKPKRFSNISKEQKNSYFPFSNGKFKCIAADKFAPVLAAILISTILDCVDKVTLTQKAKETLFQKEKLPFENNRRAFDKFEVIITKK